MTTGVSGRVVAPSDLEQRPFPRLAGLDYSANGYKGPGRVELFSRLDLVILGFWRGWGSNGEMRQFVQKLKAFNPQTLVGQYLVIGEVFGNVKSGDADYDKLFKAERENWWVRDAAGHRVQWTAQYGAYDINITDWVRPDGNAMRWPEWVANRDVRVFLNPVPEFDFAFLDNVFSKPRTAGDWDQDGLIDDPKDLRIQKGFRAGHAKNWETLRNLAPGILLVGNVDHDLDMPEFDGKLDGAFLENLMGRRWSIEELQGWNEMMRRYASVLRHTSSPKLVVFHVSGLVNDFRLFRYAFVSSLLNNGYFAYSSDEKSGGNIPWFDEYDIKLGMAVDPPQLAAWRNGIYRRRFDHGMVLVNPTDAVKRVTLEEGYLRFTGRQAPEINNGTAVRELSIPPKDGIVLMHPH